MNTLTFSFGIVIVFLVIRLWIASKEEPKTVEYERVKMTFKEVMNDLFSATDTVFAQGVEKIRNAVDLSKTVEELRDQLAAIRAEKANIAEDFNRREREIEHKVGLERNRQAQELELETRRIRIEVKEENLKKEQEAFKEQMKFHQDRFEEEIKYQRDIVEKMVGRFTVVDSNQKENTDLRVRG